MGLFAIGALGCGSNEATPLTPVAAPEARGAAKAACDTYIAPERYAAQNHADAPAEAVERLRRSAVSFVAEAANKDRQWRHLQQAIEYMAQHGDIESDDVTAVRTYVASVCERLGVQMSGWPYLGDS